VTVVDKSALVPYSADEMYLLAKDVESYPQFLPWCESALVHHASETELEASITIAKSGFRQSFTTVNTMDPGRSMDMRLKKGPFSRLYGIWHFEQLGEHGSKVSLHMDFEFSNALISKAFGPVFNKVVDSLVNAFCQRADRVYGR